MAEQKFDSDVLVVGGGPGGSTIAALLARAGLSVTLMERDQHPRFHIGESLLPMNMPIVERLGLCERLREIGVKKLGADFPADNERGYNVFSFDRCLNPTWPFAYQVQRDEFDQMLFEHAAASGATALQGAKVGRVDFDANGTTAEMHDRRRDPHASRPLRGGRHRARHPARLADAPQAAQSRASERGAVRAFPQRRAPARASTPGT